MCVWKNININKNMIKAETGRSVLIAMPHSSEYDGFKFWHPAKLVREGRHGAAASIGYSDEFVFHLKKYGNGKYNKFDVISEIIINAEEFEEAFGVTDENISSKKYVNNYETHKPQELKAEAASVNADLVDDGQ